MRVWYSTYGMRTTIKQRAINKQTEFISHTKPVYQNTNKSLQIDTLAIFGINTLRVYTWALVPEAFDCS